MPDADPPSRGAPHDATRRAFLVRAAPRGPLARVGPACLAARRVECRVCGEACEASAIRFAPRAGGVALPIVDTGRCTGCGDCVARCPTQAIVLR